MVMVILTTMMMMSLFEVHFNPYQITVIIIIILICTPYLRFSVIVNIITITIITLNIINIIRKTSSLLGVQPSWEPASSPLQSSPSDSCERTQQHEAA